MRYFRFKGISFAHRFGGLTDKSFFRLDYEV